MPLLPPPAPAVMPEMPEADTDSQQNSPAQGTCKPQQQQQLGQEQQLGEQLVAQSGKGGMPLAQPAAADVGAVAAVAAEGGGAAVQPAVQPCAAGGKPKADEHDDNTAAALLLGMGSKSESDGGGSAGSSGRNRTKADGASVAGVAGAARRRQLERSTSNGAAAANGAGGKAQDAEAESEEEEEEEEQQQIGKGRGKGRRGSSGSLRRSTRRGRTPAYRASELLGSGSDDEFEPGTKRVPKPAGVCVCVQTGGKLHAGHDAPALAAAVLSAAVCLSVQALPGQPAAPASKSSACLLVCLHLSILSSLLMLRRLLSLPPAPSLQLAWHAPPPPPPCPPRAS